ncbi:MAG TPA: NAD(P)H-dependent oxidoreductase [Cellvibrionaceae bacterium]
MNKRILLIQGHPDTSSARLCSALLDAYAMGATQAGHEVRVIKVGEFNFPLLRTQLDWEKGCVPVSLVQAQQDIHWAQHLVLFFPLWLGDIPALLKGFLEQVARPGFAFTAEGNNAFAHKGLKGRSARVVVTMGMPALVYRWYFRAHSLKSLKRNILGFVGIGPINETLIGMVGNMDVKTANKWFKKMEQLGCDAN